MWCISMPHSSMPFLVRLAKDSCGKLVAHATFLSGQLLRDSGATTFTVSLTSPKHVQSVQVAPKCQDLEELCGKHPNPALLLIVLYEATHVLAESNELWLISRNLMGMSCHAKICLAECIQGILKAEGIQHHLTSFDIIWHHATSTSLVQLMTLTKLQQVPQQTIHVYLCIYIYIHIHIYIYTYIHNM